VALALIGVALALDLGLQAQARQLDGRLAAEAELLRRAEAAIASVRAGVHPLRSGPVVADLAWPSPPEPELSMILLVDATDVAGLCRVTVRGNSRETRGAWARGPHDLQLEVLLWQPGSTCR